MSALDIAYTGGMNVGGLGSLNRSSNQRRAERDEAQELANSAARTAADSGSTEVDAKLRGVAEDFVSVFMNQIMKSMRSTVQENPAMHGDNGEKFFQQMLDQEHASTLSQGSGYGLTDLIYQSLVSKTRVQSAPAAEPVTTEVPGVAEVGL